MPSIEILEDVVAIESLLDTLEMLNNDFDIDELDALEEAGY